MANARCPVCAQDVPLPSLLNADAWRWLTCPHCAARLERKKPRYVAAFMPFFIVLTAMSGRGHRLAAFAEVLMVVILVVIFVEFFHPQLQVRKPPPKPEITLNINGPSN
jgi:hypothetical protein